MITHLEPDILECEVKWALENITRNHSSGGDGIPVELFQILKDDAVKVLQMKHKLELEKEPEKEEPEINLPISAESLKNQEFQKKIFLLY